MSQNVALLDIDETTISEELFEILRSQNITDVYLYTSQAFSPEQLEKIATLINYLEQLNLNIKGCISPIDLAWKTLAREAQLDTQDFSILQANINATSNENMTARNPQKISQINLSNEHFGSTYTRIKNPQTGEQFSEAYCIKVMQELSKLIIDNITPAPHSNDLFALQLKEILKKNQKNALTVTEIKEQKTRSMINLLQNSLSALEPKNKKEQRLKQKGLGLVTYAEQLVNQKKKLDSKSLDDLSQVVNCANKSIDERMDPVKTKENATKLAALSQQVAKKPSSLWKKIGAALLIIACAALVVAGVLAAIPSGGSSLLLSTIGGIGLASQIGIGVGVGVSAGLGAASLAKGFKTNPVTQFKTALGKLQNFKDSPLKDSPLNVAKINKGSSNVLSDWQRLQNWKVTIDGKSIQELLPEELQSVESFNKHTLKTFIMTHILKNIPETDNQREDAYNEIIPYLHQGGLLHPVASAAASHTTDCMPSNEFRNQGREINFETTPNGFKVQEIFTLFKASKLLENLETLEIVLDNQKKPYVLKAIATLEVNFDKQTGSPFELKVLENKIDYGSKQVEEAFTKPTFTSPRP